MLGRMARGAYVLFVAAMIVAWAVSGGRNSPSQPQNAEPVVWNWNI
jgi:hypothetical protein